MREIEKSVGWGSRGIDRKKGNGRKGREGSEEK